MRLFKRLATTGAVTALAGAAFAAPASAAPAVAAGTAPACVARSVFNHSEGFDVHLTNNCAGQMRVRVIVDYAPDSDCYVLPRGVDTWYSYEGILGLYDSTATC